MTKYQRNGKRCPRCGSPTGDNGRCLGGCFEKVKVLSRKENLCQVSYTPANTNPAAFSLAQRLPEETSAKMWGLVADKRLLLLLQEKRKRLIRVLSGGENIEPAADELDMASMRQRAQEGDALTEVLRNAFDHVVWALERWEKGTYGFCVVCGEAINPERLAACPEASTCGREKCESSFKRNHPYRYPQPRYHA